MKAGGLGGLWGNPVLRLCICIAGIMGSFLAYGVIQEKIMTKPYGVDESGEGILFPYSAFLVFNNRIVSVLGSAVILTLQGESLGNIAPVASYFGISFSNVVATFCQYEALKWVSFPTQTLGKCGKMIPVMILGMLISERNMESRITPLQLESLLES